MWYPPLKRGARGDFIQQPFQLTLTAYFLMNMYKALNRKIAFAVFFLILLLIPSTSFSGLPANKQSLNDTAQAEDSSLNATPLLALIKNLDVDMSWNAESGILALYSEKGKIIIMPGNRHLIAGQSVITLNKAPFFNEGVLMVDEGFVNILLSILSSSPNPSHNKAPYISSSKNNAGDIDRVDKLFKTIVIDPGHGGDDDGAVSPWGVKEKDLVLQIAKAVKKIIEDNMGIRVLLTRNDDYFVPLEERTKIAGNVKADLFISIHANSTRKRLIQGIETYFMSPDATDEDAMAAAVKENSVIELEGKTFEANSDLAFILMDISQTAHLKASSQFAKLLHENLSYLMNTSDRGVKQAPFIVLASASMPAVLLEVGFLSNKSEMRRLKQRDTHKKIAEAVLRSIRTFKGSMETKLSSRLYR